MKEVNSYGSFFSFLALLQMFTCSMFLQQNQAATYSELLSGRGF